MKLSLRSRVLDLAQPQVMGILNVTPDSFFDGGRHRTIDTALRHAEQMLGEGAVIIDVGGESTRPGAAPVGEAEELDRVVPMIEALRARFDCIVSVDTTKPEVMDAACIAGAELINDVKALTAAGALTVAVRHRASVCLMHLRGEPRTMQETVHYEDVVSEVVAYLRSRLQACIDAGVAADRIVLDPGVGFGKNLEHNLQLMAELPKLQSLRCPLLVGVSRKLMFQTLLGLPVGERLNASVAAAALAVWQGASIIRAHDVRATVEAVRVAAAVRDARERVVR